MKLPDCVKKAAPDILIGVGVGGIVTATVLAVKATEKAEQLLIEKRRELNQYKLSFKEKVKTVWKCYIPAFAVGATSAGAIIGARTIEGKRTAGAVAACQLAERMGEEYQKKVVETLGEKRERNIQDAVATEQVATHPATNVLPETKRQGLTYFYDPYNQRFVWADRDAVVRAESWLQKTSNDYNVTLSEWFDAAGIEAGDNGQTATLLDIQILSDAVGWKDPSEIEVDIRGVAVTDADGLPATVIRFKEPPRYLERW